MRVIRVLSEDTHWSGKLVSNKCPLEVMREPSSIIKQQSVSLASFPADQLVLRWSIVLFILSAQCPSVFQRLCKVSDCFVRYRVAAANCALGAFSFLVSSLPVAVDLYLQQKWIQHAALGEESNKEQQNRVCFPLIMALSVAVMWWTQAGWVGLRECMAKSTREAGWSVDLSLLEALSFSSGSSPSSPALGIGCLKQGAVEM